MNPDELARAYEAFFTKSEAGKYFMSQIHEAINDAHEKAEDNPEFAQAYTQRAKGVRSVLAHIQSVQSVGVTIKRGKPIEQ